MNPARFQVIAPVFIVGEEPEKKRFLLTATESATDITDIDFSAHEVVARRYLTRMAKVRVHQPVFRSTVLTAYDNRCSVCNLGHPPLLDAAHIVGDAEEKGIASVVNGLAMCKIHHAAFDRYFLGVRPDYKIEIRHDLLDEIDGPMLRHGLQELHGKMLMTVPKSQRDRLDGELLRFKYDQFRNATKVDAG
ncbi:MAG: HNH endonuclease [Brevibacterium aurantiacum]